MKLTAAELDALMLPDSDNRILLQLEASLQGLKEKPDWMLGSLFQLMERHADYDFGSPGGIVHFLEAYPRLEYETALIASLKRRPTTHTAWMLNRLINGTSDPARLALLDTMNQLCQAAQQDVREEARRFVAFHAKPRQ